MGDLLEYYPITEYAVTLVMVFTCHMLQIDGLWSGV